jgi:hypothetical protein
VVLHFGDLSNFVAGERARFPPRRPDRAPRAAAVRAFVEAALYDETDGFYAVTGGAAGAATS